jgi:hypothetical protein
MHVFISTENIQRQINSTNATTQKKIFFTKQDGTMWNDTGTFIMLIKQNVIFMVVLVVTANNVVILDIKSYTMTERY